MVDIKGLNKAEVLAAQRAIDEWRRNNEGKNQANTP